MMGFEPTTFCMASGSRIRLQPPPEAASVKGSGASRRHLRSTRNYRDLRAIPADLGTKVASLPIGEGTRLSAFQEPQRTQLLEAAPGLSGERTLDHVSVRVCYLSGGSAYPCWDLCTDLV